MPDVKRNVVVPMDTVIQPMENANVTLDSLAQVVNKLVLLENMA